MMRSTYFFFAVLVAATCSSVTFAQSPMLVTTSWEVSADNGQSWQAGVVQVPQSQQSVLVRHVVTWGTPGQGDYLRNGLVVPRIVSVGGIGAEDAASDVSVRQPTGIIPVPTGMGRRFSPGELLVTGSVSPPPTGALSFAAHDAILGTTFFANPVDVVRFRLTLDGSAGERIISDWVTNNPTYRVVSAATPGPYTYTIVYGTTTLIVVPSPAGLAVLGVASGMLRRRRRGM